MALDKSVPNWSPSGVIKIGKALFCKTSRTKDKGQEKQNSKNCTVNWNRWISIKVLRCSSINSFKELGKLIL